MWGSRVSVPLPATSRACLPWQVSHSPLRLLGTAVQVLVPPALPTLLLATVLTGADRQAPPARSRSGKERLPPCFWTSSPTDKSYQGCVSA